jgi:hypothetical protein
MPRTSIPRKRDQAYAAASVINPNPRRNKTDLLYTPESSNENDHQHSKIESKPSEIKTNAMNKQTTVRRIGPKSDDGLFVITRIKNTRAKFVLDTGSCVTILSYEKYSQIEPSIRPPLQEAEINLATADDSPLKVYGQCDVNLGILSRRETFFTVIVADIQVEGLLGMDFIRYFNCEIYPAAKSLVCCQEQVFCEKVNSVKVNRAKCCRLVTSQRIAIPPLSKTIILTNKP